MRMSEIKRRIAYEMVEDRVRRDAEVREIVVDHRRAGPGTLFLALRGAHCDGHAFVTAALDGGAEAAIGTEIIDTDGYVRVNDVHEVARVISPLVYGEPNKDLVFVGVTGTNGKTTVTHLIERMLSTVGRTGLIGTLGYRWGGRTIPAENTTPFPWTWYRTLAAMRSDGVRFVVAEVSSHALDQHRVAGTQFDAAVFTNFTRDHLDYHGTEEAYFAAKKRLFEEYLRAEGHAVVNLDDAKGRHLAAMLRHRCRLFSFSLSDAEADLWVKWATPREVGYDVMLSHRGADIPAVTLLPGQFNLSNLLAAVLASSPWVAPSQAVAVATEVTVPGRMERVGSRGRIFVDYAHTPDALENVLMTAREMACDGKLIVVFGAGGDRDKGKRPLMGAVAGRFADLVIVTSDNPRTEDPLAIIAAIRSGIPSSVAQEEIPDRAEAIRRAIAAASAKDVVVVAGKGAEDYQIVGNEKRHFSDREEILKALGEWR